MTIYQHFRLEERDFIDQVLQWKENVEQTHREKLTDFLDPRQQYIVKSIVGSGNDIEVRFFGGYHLAERKRALIFPSYLQINEAYFQVVLFGIDYPHKFVNITHRDILGSLMSLQVTRNKFGDILTDEIERQFLVAAEMAPFLKMEFTQIGHANVTITELPFDEIITSTETWQRRTIVSASLRIDSIISSLFHLSRQQSQAIIAKGFAKVNWKVVDQPAFNCGEGDVISLRRFGRAKIKEIVGKTRKDRYQLLVGTLK